MSARLSAADLEALRRQFERERNIERVAKRGGGKAQRVLELIDEVEALRALQLHRAEDYD